MHRFVTLVLFVSLATACTDRKSPTPMPGTSGVAGARARQIIPGGALTGTVEEQIPVGPYVYVRLATAQGEEWAAVNQAPVAVGDSLTVYNVMVMEQFASQTLKRTFARIYFGSTDPNAGAGTSGAAGADPLAGTAMPDAGASGVSPGTPPADDAKVGRVPRATGPGAHVIAELYAQQRTLAGTPVSVRGVVVKYNPGVMGKNWIHLQDGSGQAATGTHDLTVTSNEGAALGDTVVVTGVLRTNKDFGAGYVYPLVVEEARVVRK